MRREKHYYVYILTNKVNTVLYTGMTGNLEGRVYQHKTQLVKGFTNKYKVTKLVYYEELDSPLEAIAREKQIKAGSRLKKIQLIEKNNMQWNDLAGDWYK